MFDDFVSFIECAFPLLLIATKKAVHAKYKHVDEWSDVCSDCALFHLSVENPRLYNLLVESYKVESTIGDNMPF